MRGLDRVDLIEISSAALGESNSTDMGFACYPDRLSLFV